MHCTEQQLKVLHSYIMSSLVFLESTSLFSPSSSSLPNTLSTLFTKSLISSMVAPMAAAAVR